MPYFLAIDAGGTHTRCLLADSTHVLARASTTSIKLQRVSEPEATARLTAMLNEVSVAAAIPLTQVTRTCIGLAGLSIPAVRTHASSTLAAHVSGEILLVGDEEIALEAAFPTAPGSASTGSSEQGAGGILLIAGTGSNCIGRAPDGTLHRAGGYGPILGDEGSGYWIGLHALRAALHHLDCHSERSEESPHFAFASTLLHEIQRHFNLSTLPDLIALGNRRNSPVPDFAALAPVIARAASSGNSIAAATFHRAGEHLADLVTAVAHKFPPPQSSNPELSPSNLEVAFTGSILAEIPTVHAAFVSHLARVLPAARLHPVPVDPLLGALHRARLFLPPS